MGECVMHDTTQHVAINMCAPTLQDETPIAINCYEPGGHIYKHTTTHAHTAC